MSENLKELIKKMKEKYTLIKTRKFDKYYYTFLKLAKCEIEMMWADQNKKFPIHPRVSYKYVRSLRND